MAQPLPRLVLLPGLGVGEGLFGKQKSLPVRVEFPQILTPRQEESFAAYAARLAKTIDPTPPLYLGGVSFGAMLAMEMAKELNAAGVFSLSGATNKSQISPIIRILALLASGMPRALFPLAQKVTPAFLRILGRWDRQERHFLLDVFETVNFELARWGAVRIMEWRAPAGIPCPMYWIHGEIDHVVPVKAVPADAIVLGGGHFFNVSHPDATNAFITERILADMRVHSGAAAL
ncbi:MAG TPA: alpha/beta hydrolase [Tepidisphaeraceae bacterium]|jgi:pimeloyl-ACP methyl ester carboxylesterase